MARSRLLLHITPNMEGAVEEAIPTFQRTVLEVDRFTGEAAAAAEEAIPTFQPTLQRLPVDSLDRLPREQVPPLGIVVLHLRPEQQERTEIVLKVEGEGEEEERQLPLRHQVRLEVPEGVEVAEVAEVAQDRTPALEVLVDSAALDIA